MAKAKSHTPGHVQAGTTSNGSAEHVGLLSDDAVAQDYDHSGIIPDALEGGQVAEAAAAAATATTTITTPANSNNDNTTTITAPANGRPTKSAVRTPSSYGPSSSPDNPPDRTPRTPQRVRFDPNPTILHGLTPNGTATSFETMRTSGDDLDERDSLDDLDFDIGSGGREDAEGRRHRRPLLTGIEAPSVTLANSPWAGEFEDVHSWAESERQRPKSGLQSAFMNMANSIIGAGIIGQPYAFKQAGLLSGVILLIGLTVVVDWTICLIVVNSKLSGANSFQGTVEKCFGRSGLIAISLAQWLFAFGGMVAFGVVVGDTIPHVLTAIWPGLREVPVLGLLADRRAAIVVFTLGVSYPLTLYRDIAKVCCTCSLVGYKNRRGKHAHIVGFSSQKPAHWPWSVCW